MNKQASSPQMAQMVGEIPTMFHDIPISHADQDTLGMSESVNAVIRHCLGQQGESSYVVGIYGEWGSGKTSFVNLVHNGLRSETSNLPKKARPIFFRFDPWMCDKKESMLHRYLGELAAELGAGVVKADRAKKIASAIKQYADVLTPMIPVPFAGEATSAVLSSVSSLETSTKSLKDSVHKEFKKLGRRVFVFIDDLDRLPDDQIRDVFQLVNHTCSFPNVTYILAFDFSVVSAALDGMQAETGADYIQKIIQVPFSVPRFDRIALMDYFLDCIDPFFKDIPQEAFNQAHFYDVQNIILGPVLCSMREAKRLINSFTVKYSALSTELDLIDLLALSAIEVSDPTLYSWIHANKELVCQQELMSPWQEDYSRHFEERLALSLADAGIEPGSRSEMAISELRVLFPKVASQGKSLHAKDSRARRRVSSPAYFDLYFSWNAGKVTTPRTDIETLVAPDSESAVDEVLNTAIAQERLLDLLEELRCRIMHVTSQVASILARPLISAFGKSHEERKGVLSSSPDMLIGFLVNDMLRIIGMDSADKLVIPAVRAMDLDNLVGCASWVNDFELSYGRLASNAPDPTRQVISEQALEQIEKLFSQKMKVFSKCGGLLSRKHMYMPLYLWKSFDNHVYSEFLKTKLEEDDQNYAWLVIACSGEWYSGSERGFTCNGDLFEDLFERELIVEGLKRLKGGSSLEEIDDEGLCKVVTYAETESRSLIGHDFTESEAMARVPEWRGARPECMGSA